MVYLYKCAFTGIEMVSDAFPHKFLYNDVVLAVQSASVDKKAIQMDIGEPDEVDDQDEVVNDIIDGFHYNQVTYTKPQFTAVMKNYLKKVSERIKEKNPNKLALFQTKSVELLKFVVEKFSEFEFFMNENNDDEGAITFAYWEDSENDTGPTFFYFVDAMAREKI